MGPKSTVPMHTQPRPFTLKLFLDFCAKIFPGWPLNSVVITIHQVIWPSHGTLETLALSLSVRGIVSVSHSVREGEGESVFVRERE